MIANHPRLAREAKTIDAMIKIYCAAQHNHHDGALCPECSELMDYAHARLERCPFGPEKPTCAKCTVHCYKPEMRERIRQVMRFSGPKMLLKHPYLAVMHLLVDGKRKTPIMKKSKAS